LKFSQQTNLNQVTKITTQSIWIKIEMITIMYTLIIAKWIYLNNLCKIILV